MNNDIEALHQFAEDFRQEVINHSEGADEESDLFREDTFTRLVVDYLVENGELDDGHVCFHSARGIKVNGYNLDQDEGRLDLFISIFTQNTPPSTVLKSEVEKAFRRLFNFYQKSTKNYHGDIEEASDVFDLAQMISNAQNELSQIRLFLFTDGLTTVAVKPAEYKEGINISYNLWDLRRIYRCVSSGQRQETIEVDILDRYGLTIPCLSIPNEKADYNACLAMIPGELLYKLYSEFGSRLLERNVRSFLQARGKVNKGIRQTLLKEPHRFLAYNNGISATAENIKLINLPDGGNAISWIRGLQIVNGGQTTASIYQAVRKDKADISQVYVQTKLTIVDSQKADEMVPLISRYANSQNKVSEADFSSNDSFHVRVEELSRSIWAPAVDGTQRQTRWFYERARGQYLDAKGRESTPAKQKVFSATHPTSQKFTKTDLAKYENTWDQLPQIVSMGAQKNFCNFMDQFSKRKKTEVDESYFKNLIAKAILFRQTEKIVQAHKFGGYRANIVTYTLSYIFHHTAQYLDLELIWKGQCLPKVLCEAISEVSADVHNFITKPPGGQNITEWCKKEACWSKLRSLELHYTDLSDILIGKAEGNPWRSIQSDNSVNPEDQKNVQNVMEVPADTWFQISHWSKETQNLMAWQRSLAFNLGKLASNARKPSIKQAKQGLIVLNEARRLGFKNTSVKE